MTTEDKLKDYILTKYQSIREFTIDANMSYSTVSSILKRGVGNASLANIIKICNVLGISVDELANGNIVPARPYQKPSEIMVEVNDILGNVKDQLINSDGLTIGGKPANKDNINTIVQAMSIVEEMAKKK